MNLGGKLGVNLGVKPRYFSYNNNNNNNNNNRLFLNNPDTQRFNCHFPGKTGLAGYLLDSQYPVILIQIILTGQAYFLFLSTGYLGLQPAHLH